jgi:serine/threonine protein phosphatase PrpC
MLLVGSRLDRGIVRKHTPNEDSLFILQSVLHSSHAPPRLLALFVVADGMGGHEHGQGASQLAIVSLAEYVYASLWSKELLPDTFPSLLREGIQYANQAVYRRNQEDGSNMGTTITAILVNGLRAHVAHVGDSRAYHYHQSAGLVQLTQDHSLVAALVAAGAIQPDEVYTHPARNQIYRSLGQRPTIEVDSNVMPLTVGDILLLCSDGLWEMVRDREMANILAHSTRDPADAAKALVQAALTSGGVDNVSAMVVQV